LQYDATAQIACAAPGLGALTFDYLARWPESRQKA
jgi:hypothetical protein